MTPDHIRGATRRRFLAGAAGVALGSTAGCVDVRNVVGRQRSSGLSLRIKTLPMDADPYAIRIARTLTEALEAVGIDTRLLPMSREELLRHLLINHDFDLYVASATARLDPDFLRPLFHSRYAAEHGWQNPFGFSDLRVDELLDEQHRVDLPERRAVVEDLQSTLARRQPCTVVAFPDDVVSVRTDRFDGWDVDTPLSSLSYLTVDAARNADTLTAFLRDARPTRNLNPIAAEHRNTGTITELLYDSLGRQYDGRVVPWLADDWSWTDEGNDLRATVSLREARWHDGTPVTPDDVVFTYRFLADTSMGASDMPIPAERFRGRGSLVGQASLDGDRVTLSFGDAARSVAEQSLTLPVLPKHVWRDHTELVNVAGVTIRETVTEALVWDNRRPVGSGPLRVESLSVDERLTLVPTDDHFISAVGGDLGAALTTPLPYDRLEFRVVPSDAVAVELLATGDGDMTVGSLGPAVVPTVERASELDLVARPSATFYHVGYNTRNAPLSNPRFRRAVARLVDKADVVSSVFDGYATPAATPLATSDWLAPPLRWTGDDPVLPYAGDDGELNVERARDLFVDAGFRYQDGTLREA